jgi:hypothetical protein
MEILNVGPLPAEEIMITVDYGFSNGEPSTSFETLVPTEVVVKGSQNFITVKPSLAPQSKLTVEFSNIPSLISVTSKSDNIWVLDTGIRWYINAKEIKVDRK